MISPRRLLSHTLVPVGLAAALLVDPSHLGIVGDAVAHRAYAVPLPSAVVVSDLALAASVGQVLDNIRNWIIGILAGLAMLPTYP